MGDTEGGLFSPALGRCHGFYYWRRWVAVGGLSPPVLDGVTGFTVGGIGDVVGDCLHPVLESVRRLYNCSWYGVGVTGFTVCVGIGDVVELSPLVSESVLQALLFALVSVVVGLSPPGIGVGVTGFIIVVRIEL